MVTPNTPTEVTAKQLAAAKAAAKREKALAKLARDTVASQQVTASDGQQYTVVTLAASNRGRNARGICGHKRGWGGSQPKGAKRAKRQSAERMGNSPVLRTTRRMYLRPSEIPSTPE